MSTDEKRKIRWLPMWMRRRRGNCICNAKPGPKSLCCPVHGFDSQGKLIEPPVVSGGACGDFEHYRAGESPSYEETYVLDDGSGRPSGKLRTE